MADIRFNDYSVEVKAALGNIAEIALEEAAGELESQIKRNTAVDTGQLKNSWTHRIQSTDEKSVAIIGSPLENAIWEEFGTGEYALDGNGRKGGWVYVDEKGNGHFTRGKHPRRAFWRAYTTLKDKLLKGIQDRIKRGMQ